MKTIMIMSGEASGDLHGANLAREIWKQDPAIAIYGRSEEHTSELQSRLLISYAVFCLDRKSVV